MTVSGRPRKTTFSEKLWEDVARLEVKGISPTEIAKELSIDYPSVKSIRSAKNYKPFLDKLAAEEEEAIKAKNKLELLKMSPYAMAALMKGLQEGKIENVKVWAKLSGYDVAAEKDEANAVFNIVFPHQSKPETLVVQEQGGSKDDSV